MMKKLLLLCMLLCIAACSTEKHQKENRYYFLFATPLKEHKIWLEAEKGFRDACALYHLNCDWEGPTTIDTEKMKQVIETGIMQKADAIITQGVVSDALLKKANKKKIPVMLVDSDMPDSERFGYIGKDFKKQATLLLNDVEKQFGKQRPLKIAIQVAEKDFNIAKQQIAQVEAIFAQHAGGYRIISVSESKSDNVRAKKEWDRVMEEHQDINVAINFAGESASSCYEAATKHAIREQMLIYGVDEMDETIQLIKEKKINGSIVVSFYDYGYQSVEMLYEKIKGRQPLASSIHYAKLILVTTDNVDTYKKELISK